MVGVGTPVNWIHRCGAVEIQRSKLPQLARDLDLRARDLDSLIRRMSSLGQVRARGDVLRFEVAQ
jgi:hypothetical protein